jgi:hypothetical protein
VGEQVFYPAVRERVPPSEEDNTPPGNIVAGLGAAALDRGAR